jgi:Fe2+ or Zn2+ uptake regulation protein
MGTDVGQRSTDVGQRSTDVGQSELHDLVDDRLRRSGQRYTANRRALVDALSKAPQPLTIVELLENAPSVVQSSAYRNLGVLERAGAVQRIVTGDDFARYELAQALSGHHHHMVCTECGSVVDFELPEAFEVQLDAVLTKAAQEGRFDPADHQLDVIGTCADCPAG